LDEYISECEEENLDYENIHLLAAELEQTENNDSYIKSGVFTESGSMREPFNNIHNLLRIDAAAIAEYLTKGIRSHVRELGRLGAVVGLSGGIDSTVVGRLCADALGVDNVLALFMNEQDSANSTPALAREAAGYLGVRACDENITPILSACGCYTRRDEAVRRLIPEYTPGCRFKLVAGSLLDTAAGSYFIVVKLADGTQVHREAPIDVLRDVIAATNFKQRTRKMLEYHYADRFQYAVAGTPNRLEYELGFYVKNGDGAADFKPIALLYKSHVYQLAEYLGVPAAIRHEQPSTDTYPLEQTQEEFYFALPLEILDLCLFCKNAGYTFAQAAVVTGLSVEQIRSVFADIVAKRFMADYLGAPPGLIDPFEA
jgi:NAD+ synthase